MNDVEMGHPHTYKFLFLPIILVLILGILSWLWLRNDPKMIGKWTPVRERPNCGEETPQGEEPSVRFFLNFNPDGSALTEYSHRDRFGNFDENTEYDSGSWSKRGSTLIIDLKPEKPDPKEPDKRLVLKFKVAYLKNDEAKFEFISRTNYVKGKFGIETLAKENECHTVYKKIADLVE